METQISPVDQIEVHDGLEVVPSERFNHRDSLPQLQHGAGLEVVGLGGDKNVNTKVVGAEEAVVNKRRSHRRGWLIVGAVVILMIVLSGVVGGIFGNKERNAGNESSGPTPSPTISSPTTASPTISPSNPSPTLLSIRRYSHLAATGYIHEEKVASGTILQSRKFHLFYQGPDDTVRTSIKSTTYESSIKSGLKIREEWTDPIELGSARAWTNLTASTVLDMPGDEPQVRLYYNDNDGTLVHKMLPGDMNLYGNEQKEPGDYYLPISSSINTRVAAYSPFLFYMDEYNDRTYVVVSQYANMSDGSPNWIDSSYAPTNLTNAFGVVPLLADWEPFVNNMALGFVSQRPTGVLFMYSTQSSPDPPWPGSSYPTVVPPIGTAIACFAMGSGDAAGNGRTATYILYQGADACIYVIWMDSDLTWNGPEQPAALTNADNGTSIACATMAISSNVRLEDRVARCYFQLYGTVQEVELKDGDWHSLGAVPMP